MKAAKKASKKPNRVKKTISVTLSDEAHQLGRELGRKRGLDFSPFIETLIRSELRNVGMLPPEGQVQMHEE